MLHDHIVVDQRDVVAAGLAQGVVAAARETEVAGQLEGAIGEIGFPHLLGALGDQDDLRLRLDFSKPREAVAEHGAEPDRRHDDGDFGHEGFRASAGRNRASAESSDRSFRGEKVIPVRSLGPNYLPLGFST